jgi:hypothetical protein
MSKDKVEKKSISLDENTPKQLAVQIMEARELFNKKINERKFGEFWTDMSEFNKTKPKEKLTPNDPVVIRMGHGDLNASDNIIKLLELIENG